MFVTPAQFEMFEDEITSLPAEAVPARQAPRSAPSAMDETAMVAHLAATGRYRILHKLEARPIAKTLKPEYPLVGVILDTETTGLNQIVSHDVV